MRGCSQSRWGSRTRSEWPWWSCLSWQGQSSSAFSAPYWFGCKSFKSSIQTFLASIWSCLTLPNGTVVFIIISQKCPEVNVAVDVYHNIAVHHKLVQGHEIVICHFKSRPRIHTGLMDKKIKFFGSILRIEFYNIEKVNHQKKLSIEATNYIDIISQL